MVNPHRSKAALKGWETRRKRQRELDALHRELAIGRNIILKAMDAVVLRGLKFRGLVP